jgi:hypothetical protein
MSENRTFGTVISGNRQKNHEFPETARAAMLAMLEAGKSRDKEKVEYATNSG